MCTYFTCISLYKDTISSSSSLVVTKLYTKYKGFFVALRSFLVLMQCLENGNTKQLSHKAKKPTKKCLFFYTCVLGNNGLLCSRGKLLFCCLFTKLLHEYLYSILSSIYSTLYSYWAIVCKHKFFHFELYVYYI